MKKIQKIRKKLKRKSKKTINLIDSKIDASIALFYTSDFESMLPIVERYKKGRKNMIFFFPL